MEEKIFLIRTLKARTKNYSRQMIGRRSLTNKTSLLSIFKKKENLIKIKINKHNHL